MEIRWSNTLTFSEQADWQAVYGTTIRNDGYGCLGGSNDPVPNPDPPTVNEINQDTAEFLPSDGMGLK